MDTEALDRMDKEADKVIAHWSFAAIGANILPPPLDMLAVSGVFATMGARIGSVYGVQISRPVLRNLGVAVANGIGAVLAAYYVGSGLLKYIPGVNIWIALLVQPPVVGAVAYAAGHVFKRYYHKIILEGRELTTAELEELAKSALDEKLRLLRESGYRFRMQGHSSPATQPVEERPSSERQLIALAGTFGRFGWTKHEAGELLELGDQGSSLLVVAPEETKNLRFIPPLGHPRTKTVYAAHPRKPLVYYLAADFHRSLFQEKVMELSRMLRHLGATFIRIERIEGHMSEVDLNTIVGALQGGTGYKRKSGSEVMYEASYGGSASPKLAEDMVWYHHEDVWQEIADGRLRHGTTEFSLDIEYKEDFGINAGLASSIKLLRIGLGGTFTDFERTVWHVSGKFKELTPSP